jgi:hypothetical protein
MRLNKNTYPVYDLLERGRFVDIKMDSVFGEKYRTLETLGMMIKMLGQTYKIVEKKYYLTKPFKEALVEALPKITEKNKHLEDKQTRAGVIFSEKGISVFVCHPSEEYKLVCWGFNRETLTTFGVIKNDNSVDGVAAVSRFGEPYNDLEYLEQYLNSIMVSLYFIHNCDIQQKILKPQEKYRESGFKHYNETKTDIIMLDCNWFTELIRDTPFHVKGHLRWQVCGEKFSKRRLMWISDFEKKGYHRKAKVENE